MLTISNMRTKYRIYNAQRYSKNKPLVPFFDNVAAIPKMNSGKCKISGLMYDIMKVVSTVTDLYMS